MKCQNGIEYGSLLQGALIGDDRFPTTDDPSGAVGSCQVPGKLSQGRFVFRLGKTRALAIPRGGRRSVASQPNEKDTH